MSPTITIESLYEAKHPSSSYDTWHRAVRMKQFFKDRLHLATKTPINVEKPNSITLSGRRQVRSRFEAGRIPAVS